MKYLLVLSMLVINLSASIYYAKVEPVQAYNIKASASGEVISVYKDAEGKVSKGGVLIQIDDALNKEDLKNSISKLTYLKNTYEFTKQNVENSKKVAQIRKINYEKIKSLKTKSRVEKDNELISLINSQNQVLNLQNSLQNLDININDLEYKIATLKDIIAKKSVKIEKGQLLYNIHVNKGDFVNIGAQLVDTYDITSAKLTFFISKDDIPLAQNGVIYIDGKPTKLKMSKIWSVVDTQNISAYKSEIIIKAPKRFSQLVKIEFKDK